MSTKVIRDKNGLSQDFRDRADAACFWEAWVGAVLARNGLYVVHHPFNLATRDQHAWMWGQTWDLDVAVSWPDMPHTHWDRLSVEVKSQDQTFHTPKDYPYNQKIVCSHASWQKKWRGRLHTERDFLFVSQHTGAILWLPCGSPVSIGNTTDHKRGETFKSIVTDKHNLKDLLGFVESVKYRLG